MQPRQAAQYSRARGNGQLALVLLPLSSLSARRVWPAPQHRGRADAPYAAGRGLLQTFFKRRAWSGACSALRIGQGGRAWPGTGPAQSKAHSNPALEAPSAFCPVLSAAGFTCQTMKRFRPGLVIGCSQGQTMAQQCGHAGPPAVRAAPAKHVVPRSMRTRVHSTTKDIRPQMNVQMRPASLFLKPRARCAGTC